MVMVLIMVVLVDRAFVNMLQVYSLYREQVRILLLMVVLNENFPHACFAF